EVFTAHAGGGDGVGLVDRHALRAGDRRGVAELDVLGDVIGREPDSGFAGVGSAVGGGGADPERAVGQDGGDVPQGAVAHEPVGGSQAAVVAAGDDAVADAGGEPVVQRHAVSGDGPGQDAVGAGAGVEVAHGAVVERLQDRDAALVAGGG